MNFRMSHNVVVITLMAMVMTFIPQEVWACPACAMREDGGIAGTLVLAAMMMLPFGLAGAVVYVLRNTAEEVKKEKSTTEFDAVGGEQRA